MNREILQSKIHDAMRARDAVSVNRLKMILAAVQNKETAGPVSERGIESIVRGFISGAKVRKSTK